MSLEVRHITVRMGSVWKEMQAKALSSLGGTTWGVSEPFTKMKPNCSGRKQETLGSEPDFTIRRHQGSRKTLGQQGGGTDMNQESIIAIINKCHEDLKKDVTMDPHQDQMNLKEV